MAALAPSGAFMTLALSGPRAADTFEELRARLKPDAMIGDTPTSIYVFTLLGGITVYFIFSESCDPKNGLEIFNGRHKVAACPIAQNEGTLALDVSHLWTAIFMSAYCFLLSVKKTYVQITVISDDDMTTHIQTMQLATWRRLPNLTGAMKYVYYRPVGFVPCMVYFQPSYKDPARPSSAYSVQVSSSHRPGVGFMVKKRDNLHGSIASIIRNSLEDMASKTDFFDTLALRTPDCDVSVKLMISGCDTSRSVYQITGALTASGWTIDPQDQSTMVQQSYYNKKSYVVMLRIYETQDNTPNTFALSVSTNFPPMDVQEQCDSCVVYSHSIADPLLAYEPGTIFRDVIGEALPRLAALLDRREALMSNII